MKKINLIVAFALVVLAPLVNFSPLDHESMPILADMIQETSDCGPSLVLQAAPEMPDSIIPLGCEMSGEIYCGCLIISLLADIISVTVTTRPQSLAH